jgi:hypothetical protein
MTTISDAAAAMGRVGGKSRSARKQAASRANGLKNSPAYKQAASATTPAPVPSKPSTFLPVASQGEKP